MSAPQEPVSTLPEHPAETLADPQTPLAAQKKTRPFSFSFKRFSFTKENEEPHKPVITSEQEHDKRAHAAMAMSKQVAFVKTSKAKDRRAKQNAVMLRAIIVGPSSSSRPQVAKALAKPELGKLKSELIRPNSANRIINQLRSLPPSDDVDATASGDSQAHGPIRAVCLALPDEEEHQLRFASLGETPDTFSVDALASLLSEMKVIDLVRSPDLGLGQPGDGEGLLAGALPTPETIIHGIKQITPELMALGYATGQSFTPDHTGIYPPTDRLSVFTYWWGLELVLPPPSLVYLANAQSITGTVVNFLSALAMINNGVREILPFVRYISQFVEFEFSAIRKQDRGQGVVCAATWIMPAALVPRPWDFPEPPSKVATGKTGKVGLSTETSEPANIPLSNSPPVPESEEAGSASKGVPAQRDDTPGKDTVHLLEDNRKSSDVISPSTNVAAHLSPGGITGRLTT